MAVSRQLTRETLRRQRFSTIISTRARCSSRPLLRLSLIHILDVNSGAVHSVDDVAYDIIDLYDEGKSRADITNEIRNKYEDISVSDIDETLAAVSYTHLDVYKRQDILRALRASQKAPGEERIYTAGEKEWDIKEFRKDKGVPMGEAVQREFIEVRDSLGIDFKFPFE